MKLKELLKEFIEEEQEKRSLTIEEKKEILEIVSEYNSFSKHIGIGQKNLREISESILKVCERASTFCESEAEGWFEGGMIKKDMKRMKEDAMEFKKVSEQFQSSREKLAGLYENIGHILERYFDISEIEEEPLKEKKYSACKNKKNKLMVKEAVSLEPIANNFTKVSLNQNEIYFSYKTPVAFKKDKDIYITTNKFSNTTTKQLNKLKSMLPSDVNIVDVTQEDLESILESVQ